MQLGPKQFEHVVTVSSETLANIDSTAESCINSETVASAESHEAIVRHSTW